MAGLSIEKKQAEIDHERELLRSLQKALEEQLNRLKVWMFSWCVVLPRNCSVCRGCLVSVCICLASSA